MRVARRKPDLSATRWMGCPRITSTYSNEVYDDDERQYKEHLTASASICTGKIIIFAFMTLTVLLISK